MQKQELRGQWVNEGMQLGMDRPRVRKVTRTGTWGVWLTWEAGDTPRELLTGWVKAPTLQLGKCLHIVGLD